MTESPSLSDTVIDNLITRKEIRDDALRRLRARDRLEVKDYRRDLINTAIRANAISPVSKALIKSELSESDFPKHLALIPDGNRRWARSRGLTVGDGYAKGAEVIQDFRKWAMVDNTVDIISTFLLSTENIERRPEDELEQLYGVFVDFFNGVAENPFVHENNIRHEIRGSEEGREMLPDEVIDAMDRMEAATEEYEDKRFIFLMPYGGRNELVEAARKTNRLVGGSGGITEYGEESEEFRENLMLGDLPDVDLMMRTSEVRLSNFMLYHNAYAEFVFHQKNWPSFTESDFYESIYKYTKRDRRFGV